MDDFWFLHQRFGNHCPETGRCGLLMYINEICSMVVFFFFSSFLFIDPGSFNWLIKSYQSDIRNRWRTPQSDVWFCLTPKIHFGGCSPAKVSLLAWSKVFHVKFYLYLSEPFLGVSTLWWIHNIFVMLIISQVLCLHVCLGVAGWCFFRERENRIMVRSDCSARLMVLGEVWLFYIIAGYPG